MKNLENLPEELFDLLAEKPFSALSETEKKRVNTYLHEAEYEEYRALVLGFKQLEGAKPDAPPKLEFAPKKTPLLRRLLTYRVPVYQAATVLLLLMAGWYGFSDSNRNQLVDEAREEVVGKQPTVLADSTQHRPGTPLADEDYPEGLVFNF